MLNDIVDGISIRLNELFGDSCEIYTEDMEQDIADQCFFVNTLETSQSEALGNRKHRGYPFNLTYISKGGKRDLRTAADKLTAGMELIRLPDDSLMRGTGMHGEIVDGVLQFFVEYNAYVLIAGGDDSEKMADIRINVKG